ncbi:MAG: cell surface protein SprA [Ferruginibacter sp.]
MLTAFTAVPVFAGTPNSLLKVTDTVPLSPDSLHYPIYDRYGDFLSNPQKGVYDFQPSNIKDSVVYDSKTRRYTLYEKIGSRYYRNPVTYSYEEYWAMRGKQAENEYFRKRANTMNVLNRKVGVRPKLNLGDNLFNRLFGNGKVSISPTGTFDVLAGYQGQHIKNPTLPERAQKNGGVDFDMNAQVAVNANIGDKLKFPINYNTLANFGQDNQLKLDYTGLDDEIIKRLEAGNVSFPSRSTLIPGAQSLFGLKTQLQFGKLYVTTVLANQKSTRQSTAVQGGATSQLFEIKADEYEENRHFLLAQYFRKNYNNTMSKLPAITTPVQILRMEVWVTNKNGTPTDTRDVVGLADLGEGTGLPFNDANPLYSSIISNTSNRNPALVVNNLINAPYNLRPVESFEKIFARKLDSTQYFYNKQVGFISLQQPLQTDEVLAVAYQYSYNGKIYQVGEFSQDLPPDSSSATQKILFLKLLKATSQRPQLPIWQLMMKNVYSVGYGTLQPTDFTLDVLYQEPALGWKRYVPFGNKNLGSPIISLLNLDRLNNQLDPQPDGKFDYVEGFTVISQYSRVIFPVLEPFGRDLAAQTYTVPPPTAKDTLYYALYDSIKAVAQQFPNLNRFVLKGSARTSGSSDISIGYNVPKGSVTVTAGGRVLTEGVDYDINYDLGTVKIINAAIINAGLPVQISSESDASFGIVQKSYLGLRLDYNAMNTAKQQLSFGGTLVRLSERPFLTKVQLNEDPIRNTMYGVDVNYRRDMPRLTKLLDKLPFYQTKAPSGMNLYLEGAYFKPGHAPQIGKGSNGLIYIDDFEGSHSGIDLRFPQNIWALASVPQGATVKGSSTLLFPEATLNNDLSSGKNRAKISWYQIEPALQQYKGPNNPLGSNRDELSDPRVRQVYQQEIFPQKTTGFGQSQLTTFDLSYYPTEKGPYNFDATNVDANNKLINPNARWGGLMRNIDQTDFETNNIEFIEFWVQDPFIKTPISPTAGGKLYFNLGNVSEDILKDGRRFYENGLPTPNAPSQVDTSAWGRVPRNPIQVTNAFSNDPADRAYQDVGLDGLSDDSELVKRQPYINQLGAIVTPAALQAVKNDPSADNYHNYRGDDYDAAGLGILGRYKNFNNPQGNSPVASSGSEFSSAATLYPDAEDLNRDNTMNETEEYFQYVVDIKPNTDPAMTIGNNFIVDKKVVTVTPPNGITRSETWYQFRIPIGSYDRKIGNIPDFKSIRFIRMFLTDFRDSVTMRFGELQLTRNMWRKFTYKIDSTGNVSPELPSNTSFTVGAVNIEENDSRSPLPYRTPKSIERQQTQSNNGVNLLQNEQAMTIQVCNLEAHDSRAVEQTFASRDLRQFRKLSMFIHEEDSKKVQTLRNDDLSAVIRIGNDFTSNYYEIKIPLKITSRNVGTGTTAYFDSDAYSDTLWNAKNSLDVDLQVLTQLKQARNLSSTVLTQIFRRLQPNGHTYSIIGNPDLGQVRGILMGVENTNASVSDACAEIWFNELRLSSIDENGGWAALGRADFTLADLGTISVSANTHTQGFGNLEQRVNERFRDDFFQFDVNATMELGKLLPKRAAISIPVQATFSQTISKPQYDPYDGDVTLKDKLSLAPSNQRDSIRNNAIDFTATKSVSITNMRKNRTGKRKPMPWDISNIDISASYLNIKAHNPLIENNEMTKYRAAVGYNYAPKVKTYEPFKRLLRRSKTHWFDLIKDFNFNPLPAQISFRADVNRQFGAIRPRSIGVSKYAIPETYDKYFTFQRDYILSWPFTRSLKFDFTATNNSRIDEPYGRLDTKEKRDTVRRNFFAGGRNVLYNHTANFSYTLPTSKFPLIDWTTINLKYQATYRWIGASRLVPELGNILENGQQQEASMQLDFTKLYNKLKFFRIIDQPQVQKSQTQPKPKKPVVNPLNLDGTKKTVVQLKKEKKTALTAWRGAKKARNPYVGTAGRVFGKLITSLKQVNVSVTENANTRLPGYTDSTQYVGQNWNSMAPGTDFILGRQPDSNWLNRAAAKHLITKDSTFNSLFSQNFDQRLTLSATIEPVRDLNITVNVSKTFNKNYTETFKDTTGTGSHFGHLSPYAGGGFDVTYTAFKTLFGKFDPNRVSATFVQFEDYRKTLSKRLGTKNPYNTGLTPDAEGYYKGYNKYATDVLIPAFIAAYTGQDPDKVSLIKQDNANIKSNPFRSIIPRPNWKIDYNGLSRVKGLDKVFTSFTLSHGYDSHLSMNGFTSALLYEDVSRYGYPSFYDTLSKNYVPYFLIPNITISENFAPLIGVDMTFTNQLQAKFEYAKSRTLSLSLIDFQLSEVRSTQFSIGAGYRKRGLKLLGGLKLPHFLNPSGGNKLQNEINFRFDYKISDNVTANSRLDQENNYATSGAKETTITPSIDYFLNSRVNVKLYFDQRIVKPYISSSAPITNTRAGVQIRVSLQ